MTVTQRNTPLLHRKEWQQMTPAPVSVLGGMYVIAAGSTVPNRAMYVTSSTVQFLYDHDADGWFQIPSAAMAGAFGAGVNGTYTPWSITYTATGGCTTTVTVAAATHNITSCAEGETIDFISSGTNTGQRRRIVSVRNDAGAGTVTLTMDSAVSTAVLNSHTFRLTTGRFFLMSAGTTAAGSWKTYDVATNAWQANLSVVGFPASWATDGKSTSTAKVARVEANGTATSGSTTTLVDTSKTWAVDQFTNKSVMVISGTGSGQVARIISNTATILTIETVGIALDATSVYQIRSSRAGYAAGRATSGSATTVVNSAATWTVNQWTNFQVRIVSGTGAGQIRVVVSNTGTTLTIGTGATIDSTSVYVIEGDEDKIFMAGNSAVAMYRYSISANTWTTLTPTVARTGVPGAGMGLDWVDSVGASVWANESDIQDGRYIYAVRAGAGALIDRFDIAGGTGGAGAWAAVTYVGTETFASGSSTFQDGRYIYVRKDATNRFFRYDIVGNQFEAFNTDTYTDGAAALGQKMWVKSLDATGAVEWMYSLANSGTALRRIMVY